MTEGHRLVLWIILRKGVDKFFSSFFVGTYFLCRQPCAASAKGNRFNENNISRLDLFRKTTYQFVEHVARDCKELHVSKLISCKAARIQQAASLFALFFKLQLYRVGMKGRGADYFFEGRQVQAPSRKRVRQVYDVAFRSNAFCQNNRSHAALRRF